MYLVGELRKLNQDLSEDELDQIVFIHGFVLKGTSNAKYYRSQDLFWKHGKDRLQRYSINGCHNECCVAVESKKAEKDAWLIDELNGEEPIKRSVKRASCLRETRS